MPFGMTVVKARAVGLRAANPPRVRPGIHRAVIRLSPERREDRKQAKGKHPRASPLHSAPVDPSAFPNLAWRHYTAHAGIRERLARRPPIDIVAKCPRRNSRFGPSIGALG